MTEITHFWLNNPDIWFNSTSNTDNIIKSKFGVNPEKLLVYLKNKPIEYLNNIIVYDQIVRHIYRNDNTQIMRYNNIAVNLCNDGLKQKYDLELTPSARCFFLMPLRHTFNADKIQKVINIIKKYDNWKEIPEYVRFYKASVKSLSKLISNQVKKENIYTNNQSNNFEHICDFWSQPLLNIDRKHPLILISEKFLQKYYNHGAITISLSGGVDSMVCCYIFNFLKTIYPFELKAVHINYNNRSSCTEEKKFLNWFCSLLEVDLYIRDIYEIQRTRDTMRTFYEEITQEIRFDTYKVVGGNVILGHNKDDCIENIFCNIRKKRNFDNLTGMSYTHIQNDVEIWRPFLNIDKQTLINFAKEHNIPYLVDSTPTWSDRGKMRDCLIPEINKFSRDIIPGLFDLSNKINEQNTLLEELIYKPFTDDIIWEKTKVITNNNNKLPETFWKDIMIQIARHLNCKYPSNKSIYHFMKWICKPSIAKIDLNKHISIEKTEYHLVFRRCI